MIPFTIGLTDKGKSFLALPNTLYISGKCVWCKVPVRDKQKEPIFGRDKKEEN